MLIIVQTIFQMIMMMNEIIDSMSYKLLIIDYS